MSRRDTIIAAVLLNTGLLAVLFMMAMTPSDQRVISEEREASQAFAAYQPIVETRLPEPVQELATKPERAELLIANSSSSDEVDSVLKDFAATFQANTLAKKEEVKEKEASLLCGAPQVKSLPLSRSVDERQEYVEVTVKNGDILGRIAQANGTSVAMIKQVNSLTSDRLKVGQVIKVPVGTKKKTAAPLMSQEGSNFYTLQSGDNPWKIARKFGVSVSELLRLNDLDEARARSLKPGDRVRVK